MCHKVGKLLFLLGCWVQNIGKSELKIFNYHNITQHYIMINPALQNSENLSKQVEYVPIFATLATTKHSQLISTHSRSTMHWTEEIIGSRIIHYPWVHVGILSAAANHDHRDYLSQLYNIHVHFLFRGRILSASYISSSSPPHFADWGTGWSQEDHCF